MLNDPLVIFFGTLALLLLVWAALILADPFRVGRRTTERPTKDNLSAADVWFAQRTERWPETGFTTPGTPASSQSAPPAMPSGPAEPTSGCAHLDVSLTAPVGFPLEMEVECRKCGASVSYARIPVQGAERTPSTYLRLASTPSVPGAEAAPSSSFPGIESEADRENLRMLVSFACTCPPWAIGAARLCPLHGNPRDINCSCPPWETCSVHGSRW